MFLYQKEVIKMILKDLDFRKRWIQWALDFIQLDLDSLSKIGKIKLAGEISFFCGNFLLSDGEWEDYEYNLSSPPERRGDGMNVILRELEKNPKPVQDGLKSFIENLERIKKNALEDYRAFLKKKSSAERDFLIDLPDVSSFIAIGFVENKGVFFIESHPKRKGTIKGNLRELSPEDQAKYWTEGLEDWAISNFSKLIEDLGVDSINKCKGCGRYFVNFTKREKVYCNASCASRSIAQMKRNELRKHPKKYKAYLKKQKEYMRKKYVEFRKAQFGPNVKVGRKEG
jgi:hypothetical protein